MSATQSPSLPAAPGRTYSFTSNAANNPTNPPPGDQLDAELDRTNSAVGGLIAFVANLFNADGSLKPDSVTAAALNPALVAQLDAADSSTLSQGEAAALKFAEYLGGPTISAAQAADYIAASPFPNNLFTATIPGDSTSGGLYSAKFWALRASNPNPDTVTTNQLTVGGSDRFPNSLVNYGATILNGAMLTNGSATFQDPNGPTALQLVDTTSTAPPDTRRATIFQTSSVFQILFQNDADTQANPVLQITRGTGSPGSTGITGRETILATNNLLVSGQGGVLVPIGPTQARPNPGAPGWFRYNTDTNQWEFGAQVGQSGSSWITFAPIIAPNFTQGLTVSAGGTNLTGGLTVRAGGADIAGGTTIRDGLTAANGALLVGNIITRGPLHAEQGATIDGGATINAGATIANGLTVQSGGAAISGGLSVGGLPVLAGAFGDLFKAFLATLPTTRPAAAGQPWLNAGALSVS